MPHDSRPKDLAFEETYTIDAAPATLRATADGYLVCNPRVARTGIQVYSGAEVGMPGLDRVRVYRPEREVFAADALSSLAHKPVTVEHPSEPVSARNWRDLAVGHLGGEVVRDGEYIRVPLVLMDSSAIETVRSGKSQLSVGYTARLDWADGVTPSGEPYDVTQTAIRANHVAITHTARGGSKLRMGDSKERKMTTRTVLIDGIGVEMEERDLQVVERRIAALEKDLGTARSQLATAQTEAQTELATSRTETANSAAVVQTKDAEIATLKQQLTDAKLTPQALDTMVHERVQTVQRATALHDGVLTEGKTDAEIRRQVVNVKLGDVAKTWTDDMITASFNTLSTTTQDSGNSLGSVVSILRSAESSGGDPRIKAYNEYETDLSNRWKTAGIRSK